jgi:hypothetical protein
MRGMRRTHLRVCPRTTWVAIKWRIESWIGRRMPLRIRTNAKVSVFGTRDCEHQFEAKSEEAEGRSRTDSARISNQVESAEKAAREPDNRPRDPSHSLGTPASKGWRRFRGKWGSHEGQTGDRTARCVIRQNQAHRNNEAWHRAVAETHSARCKRTRKVSVFGTLSAVREKTGATSLQRNSTRCERKRHGQNTFNLQSESARDSCPRASQASGRDRSTSRQSSGCGTWRPKPFCAP